MSEVASRLYASATAAGNAIAGLRYAGYRDDEFTVIDRPDGDAATAYDAVFAAARAAGVFKGRAASLADGVVNGNTAVICRARFWTGVLTRRILDEHDPIDAGDMSGSTVASSVEAAPLSGLLGLPVLGGRGDLLSRLLRLPTLSAKSRGSARLTGQTGPYKPSIPLPLLSGGGGGYKPVIPLPTLSGNGARGGYRPTVPLPLLSGSGGGYKPVVPLPTLSGTGRGKYRPVVPLPLLTGDSD